ncbi:MAG: hypothetical protein WAM60_15985 [Candidatus Promineifilaceae bacterium]
MIEKDNNYHAYLLRLWRENEDSSWRVVLQDARTGQKISFTELDKLTAFLEDKIEGRLVDFKSDHL